MKELIIKLNAEEKDFLEKKKWNDLTDTLELEDILSDYIQLYCISLDDDLTKEGLICESILNKIGELE